MCVQCGLDGKFSPPDWVASPPPKFEHAHLRVIKDGTLVSRIALGKRAFVLVGRVATCDVVAEHRSISRQHAVVGWDALGTLYVQDLDTNWGTFVDDAKAYNPTHSFAATQRNAAQRNAPSSCTVAITIVETNGDLSVIDTRIRGEERGRKGRGRRGEARRRNGTGGENASCVVGFSEAPIPRPCKCSVGSPGRRMRNSSLRCISIGWMREPSAAGDQRL